MPRKAAPKKAQKPTFDVGAHVLVPKHEKLTDKQKESLLKAYGVDLKKLPKIHVADPAIQGLEPKVGDIIKISRKSPTSQSTVYYRGVTNE